VISSVLAQNPKLHSNTNSVLAQVLGQLNLKWPSNPDLSDDKVLQQKRDTLRGTIMGYYASTSSDIILDRNLGWVPLIALMEDLLQTEIKILVCVRNPAEILSSYERTRIANPAVDTAPGMSKKDRSSIASRAFYYSGPDGQLGKIHRNIQDAVIMGYLDRMLFVDYGMYCSNPRSQTRRIYDFFGMEEFSHDFQNIAPGNPGVRPQLEKITVNCVQYLGLDLFDQYNSQIFWNAWV
jgi:hypothetical protein